MNRRELTLNSHAVRYYDAGSGPPVLLVHGAGATGRLWHRQMGPLSQKFRVVAPDLPGFGGTDAFPDIKDVRGYGRFLAEFLAALGLDPRQGYAGRVNVVGSSMGGWAAAWLALDRPDMLGRLVLVSPAGLYSEDEPPMPVERVVKEVEAFYAKSAECEKFACVKPSEEMEKGVAAIKAMDAAGGFKPDLTGRLGGIKAETLVAWGSEDRVVPVSYARAFAEGIPGARLVVMEGAGHLPYVERADEFNGIVLRFLAG